MTCLYCLGLEELETAHGEWASCPACCPIVHEDRSSQAMEAAIRAVERIVRKS